MGNIRVLPDEISNRIAAGEVVERPASVVKELVENAIDAGATSILIEIGRAGSRLIAVSDDGSGMDADDALLCFEPHGTSKIHTAEDIDRILTLGFRGEAIPSIAAVSRFRLKTRRSVDPAGVEVEVESGRVGSPRPYGGAPGTRVEVADLFFNVPARRKFLRSATTEEGHIQETVMMLALPNPGVAFELRFDGKPLFRSPVGRDLRGRLREFFGRTAAERFLPVVSAEADEVKVSGFIAPPDWTRTSRREQRTFVNRRMVDSAAIYRGIRDGYGERAEAGRFPPVVLFVELDCGDFDINVHPTKKEVRFRNENRISQAVAQAIRATLRGTPGPQLKLAETVSLDALLGGAAIAYEPPRAEQLNLPPLPPGAGRVMTSNVPAPAGDAAAPEDEAADADAPGIPLPIEPLPPTAEAEEEIPEACRTISPDPPSPFAAPEEAAGTEEEEVRFLGIFARCYILVERGGELWIIDQHAAHERVLFERLLVRGRAQTPMQQLLLPLTLELDRRTAQFLGRHRAVFCQLGFDLAELSSRSIMINAIPAELPGDLNIERLVLDLFDELFLETAPGSLALGREAVARAACKAAVKAHDVLTEEEAMALVRSLRRCTRPDCCPHGRPTSIRLSQRELERRFGRS